MYLQSKNSFVNDITSTHRVCILGVCRHVGCTVSVSGRVHREPHSFKLWLLTTHTIGCTHTHKDAQWVWMDDSSLTVIKGSCMRFQTVAKQKMTAVAVLQSYLQNKLCLFFLFCFGLHDAGSFTTLTDAVFTCQSTGSALGYNLILSMQRQSRVSLAT